MNEAGNDTEQSDGEIKKSNNSRSSVEEGREELREKKKENQADNNSQNNSASQFGISHNDKKTNPLLTSSDDLDLDGHCGRPTNEGHQTGLSRFAGRTKAAETDGGRRCVNG